MAMATETTHALVQRYYASWQDGGASFDEASVRSVLDANLEFEGPIAGRRVGADGFLKGLGQFARALHGLRMLQQVESSDMVASLYDCALGPTSGTLRFAEFIHVERGLIRSITLVYDPVEFRRLVG